MSKGIRLTVDNDVVEKLSELGYSKEYGARNIQRQVVEMLENKLAEHLISLSLDKKRQGLVEVKASLKDSAVTFS